MFEGGAGRTYTIVCDYDQLGVSETELCITIEADVDEATRGIHITPNSTCFTAYGETRDIVVQVDQDNVHSASAEVVQLSHTGLDVPALVDITIVNSDSASAQISDVEGTVSYLASGSSSETYTVVLNTVPQQDVIVTISDDFSSGLVSVIPSTLTFEPGNWDQPQTVTISAIAGDGSSSFGAARLRHTLSSLDPLFDNAGVFPTEFYEVRWQGDLRPEIVLSTSALSVPEGVDGVATYRVRLDTAVASGQAVVVRATPEVDGEGLQVTATPSELTFTDADWSDEQEITLFYPRDNLVRTSTLELQVTHSLADPETTDSFFADHAVFWPSSTVTATIAESDQAKILLSDQTAYVTEGGATATYYLQLSAKPSGDVSIAIANPNPTLVSVSPNPVVITPAQWNADTPVVLTGEVASGDDGNDFFSALTVLTHSATSSDVNFDEHFARFAPSPLFFVRRIESPESAPCSPGTYNAGLECEICPPGHSCPDGTTDPVPCNLGSYALAGQRNCTACPAGSACPTRFEGDMVQCDPGTHADGGEHTCHTCAAGHYCPHVDQSIELPCSAGSYSVGGQSECTECPPGRACPDVTGTTITVCAPGSYAVGGVVACTPCPAGFACLDTGRAPTSADACLAGSYTASGGGASACILCPPGYECPYVDQAVVTPCLAGEFATGNATSCQACPAGMQCTRENGPTAPCELGTYSPLGQQDCLPCPAGSRCPTTTAEPEICAPGTFAAGNAVDCTSCGAGMYCPTDSTVAEVPCEAGTYSTGGASSCTPCDPGYWCSPGATEPSPSADICPIGGWCTPPSVSFTYCVAGTYGITAGGQSANHACVDCPAGFACAIGISAAGMAVCEPGHYCPEGTRYATQFPCPAGTYQPDAGASSIAACLVTQEGSYSGQGSSTFSPCPAGHYCPEQTGNYMDFPCPAGTYSGNQEGLEAPSDCMPCDPGHYCPTGSITPTACPEGTYNPSTGAAIVSDCTICPAGWDCALPAMITYTTYTCQAGYYCPLGSDNAFEFPCPAGTYYDGTDAIAVSDCLPCPERQACPEGTGGTNGVPTACAAGHYCPIGTQYDSQFDCPPGTYTTATNLASATECTECPAGRYCSGGLAYIGGVGDAAGVCAAGHYCPLRSQSPTDNPCPAGTFTRETDLSAVEECEPCPEGHYCELACAEPEPCPAGSFSDSLGEDSPLCTPCPEGHACAEGTIEPVPCLPGEYAASSQETCETCPKGHYCKNPSNATTETQMLAQECPAGLYCPAGVDVVPNNLEHACPRGFYCEQGVADPVGCPPGTINPYAGMSSLTDCTLCTAGHYCTGENYVEDGVCDAGYYCPPGTTGPAEFACPPGTHRNTTGAIAIESCTVCSPGTYCPGATINPIVCPHGSYCGMGVSAPEPCPLGRYGATEGLGSMEDCTPCIAGMYCDGLGLPAPTGQCDPGHYCLTGSYAKAPGSPGSNWTHSVRNELEAMLLFSNIGDYCPPGHYCGQGTALPEPCEEGTFNPTTGSKTSTACVSCLPGSYCAGAGNSAPTGPCAAGYYCPAGSSSPTQEITPPGYYSEAGASAPSPCQHGNFTSEYARSFCDPCLEGFFCGNTSIVEPEPCPAGTYCPEGAYTPSLCPAGTFGAAEQLVSVTECTVCTAGSYCSSNGLAAPTAECEAGYYCLEGSHTAVPLDGINGDECGPGTYCEQGSPQPTECDLGTYNPDTRSTAASACIPCDAGSYCNERGLAAPVDECGPGSYCPSGTATPSLCPPGTYSNTTAATSDGACQACPPGKYCAGEGNAEPTGFCLDGYYCPLSSPNSTLYIAEEGYYAVAGDSQPTKCASGTYNDELGQSECKPCPEGFYCPGVAVIVPTVCPAGSYCALGSSTPSACPPGTYGNQQQLTNSTACFTCPAGSYCETAGLEAPTGICPVGTYCEEGTITPDPCPAGTFSGETQLVNVTECVPCTPGSYCGAAGLDEPTGPCEAGYYCELAATVNAPDDEDDDSGGLCWPGHFCPDNTTLPEPCPLGTFNPSNGSQSLLDCLPCTAGFFCGQRGMVAPSGECLPGEYCPLSTETPLLCAPGTYSNVTQATSVDTCELCTPGHYCAGEGNAEPTGPCLGGFYCEEGSTEATAAVSAAGYYSPEGSFQPTKCASGTYNDELGQSECKPCPEGFYCPGVAVIVPTVCPAGSYCALGSSTPSACPPGTYGNQQQLTNSTACFTCPAGSYCETAGLEAPTGICPVGTYCEEGTITPDPCPAGTFSGETQLVNVTECVPCTPGSYCGAAGLDEPTGPCEAGYYCELAATVNAPDDEDDDSGGLCWPGHFCTDNTTLPEPCPLGTFNPSNGSQSLLDCLPCIGGFYCGERGLVAPSGECLKGEYCPVSTVTPFVCAPGTYSNVTQATSVDTCELCTPGSYCSGEGNAEPTGLCAAGHYCPLGSNSSFEFVAVPGEYAVEGSGAPTLCARGFYNDMPAQSACMPCPAGFFCSETGTIDPTECPTSSFCEEQSEVPEPCPPGTYGAQARLVAETDCTRCPAGSYCETQGLDEPTGPCEEGTYCPEGTQTPALCPAGTFSAKTMLTDVSECEPCTPGSYCGSAGLQEPTGTCDAGHYCKLGANVSALDGAGETGGLCWPGHFCPDNTTLPEPCPLGTYNPSNGSQSLLDCLPCTAGFFCGQRGMVAPSGECVKGEYCPTSTVTPLLCAPGTYSNVTQATSVDTCELCTPGHYCAGEGNAEPTGPCLGGFYCEEGSTNATANVSPIGHFSPPGAYQPSKCLSGTYNDELGAEVCDPCPAGFYCPNLTMSEPLVCVPGSFCVEGSAVPERCLPGTMSTAPQLEDASACELCVEGSYCAERGMPAPSGLCAAGHYCFRGSGTRTPGGETEVGGDCWPGHYCYEGTTLPEPCPLGTFNPSSNGIDLLACLPCPPGSYCGATGLEAPSGPCNAGYFCTSGSMLASPNVATGSGGPCTVGHYCPEGSDRPMLCPEGTFMLEEGASECDPCVAGYHCDGNNETQTLLPCPAGSYCPEGSGAIPPKCPPGTFSNATELARVEECRKCLQGMFCADYGLLEPTDVCLDGFVCDPGSKTAYGGGVECYDGDLLPAECPRGYYCLYGHAIECPLGTFNDRMGGDALEDCRPCTAGHWCKHVAIGFQEDYLCPAGHYCESSTSLPVPCPVGTYRDEPGAGSLEECLACPPGYFCPGDEQLVPRNDTLQYWDAQSGSTFPLACSEGTYCEGSNTIPVLCPAGYRSKPDVEDGFRITMEDSCIICPPGHHGSDPARLTCSHCTEGHICLAGGTTATPVSVEHERGYVCPAGFYCPMGAVQEQPCPVGTFRNETGGVSEEASCQSCPAGTFNDWRGQTGCKPCATSSFSGEHASKCQCVGRNRAFEPASGKCLCIPGFEAFDQSSGLSVRLADDEDSSEDCQPITFSRCALGQVLSADGTCILEEERCALECAHHGGAGRISTALGMCDCITAPLLDHKCNRTCREAAVSARLLPDNEAERTIVLSSGAQVDLGAGPGYYGLVSCLPGRQCRVVPCRFPQTGSPAATCTYDGTVLQQPQEGAMGGRRQLQASTAPEVALPIVCIHEGDTVVFDLSEPVQEGVGRNFPVYKKDSLLNSNPDFDYSAFRMLRDADFIKTFGFTFHEPGMHVFGSSLRLEYEVVYAVLGRGRACPTDAPIVPRSSAALLALGARQQTGIILEPDWTLIAALFGGVVGLVLITTLVLFLFREFALGTMVIVPYYRRRNTLTAEPKRVKVKGRSVSPVAQGLKRIGLPTLDGNGGGDAEGQKAVGLDRWGEEDLDARVVVERIVNNHEEVRTDLKKQDEKVVGKLDTLQGTLVSETEELRKLLKDIQERQKEAPKIDPSMFTQNVAPDPNNAIDWSNISPGDESVPLDVLHAKEEELLEDEWTKQEEEEMAALEEALARQDSEDLVEQDIKEDEQRDDLEESLLKRSDISEDERDRILEDFQNDQEMLKESLQMEKRRQQEDLKNRLAQRKLGNRRALSRRQRRARKSQSKLNLLVNKNGDGDGDDSSDRVSEETAATRNRAAIIMNEARLLAAQEESELAEMDLGLEREKLQQSLDVAETAKKGVTGQLSEDEVSAVAQSLEVERTALQREQNEREAGERRALEAKLLRASEEALDEALAMEPMDDEEIAVDDDIVGTRIKAALQEIIRDEVASKLKIEEELQQQLAARQSELNADVRKALEQASNDEVDAEKASHLVGKLRAEHDAKMAALGSKIAEERKRKYQKLQERIAEKKRLKATAVVQEVLGSDEGADPEHVAEEVEHIVSANIEEAEQRVNVELEERRKEDAARRMALERMEANLAQREAELLTQAAALKKGEDAEAEISKLREAHKSCTVKLEQAQTKKREEQREALRKRAEERKKKRAKEAAQKAAEEELKRQDEERRRAEEEAASEVVDQKVGEVAAKLRDAATKIREEQRLEAEKALAAEHARRLEEIKAKQMEEQRRLEKEMEEAKERMLAIRREEEAAERQRLEELKRKEEETLAQSAATAQELEEIKRQHERDFNAKVAKAKAQKMQQREKLRKKLEEKKRRKQALLEAKHKVEEKKAVAEAQESGAADIEGRPSAGSGDSNGGGSDAGGDTAVPPAMTQAQYMQQEAMAISNLFQTAAGKLSPAEVYRAVEKVLEPRHSREKTVLGERHYKAKTARLKDAYKSLNEEKHGRKMQIIQSGADVEALEELDIEYKEKFKLAEAAAMTELGPKQDQEESDLHKRQAEEVGRYVATYSSGPRDPIRVDEEKEVRELKRMIDLEREARIDSIKREQREDEERAQHAHERDMLELDKNLQSNRLELSAKADLKFQQLKTRLLEEQAALQDKQMTKLAGASEAVRSSTRAQFALDKERLASALQAERMRQQRRLDGRVSRLRARTERKLRARLDARLKEAEHLAQRKRYILEDSLRRMFNERTLRLEAVLKSSAGPFSPLMAPIRRGVRSLTSELFKDINEIEDAATDPKQMLEFRRRNSLRRIQALNASFAPAEEGDAGGRQHESAAGATDSALAGRLQSIEHLLLAMRDKRAGPEGETMAVRRPQYVDPLDASLTETKSSRVVPISVDALDKEDQSRLPLAQRILRVLGMQDEVELVVARSCPAAPGSSAFRHSFYWDPRSKQLAIRVERLRNVGDFVLVLVNCLAHIRTRGSGEAFDEGDPSFMRELHASLRKVSADMCRAAPASGGALMLADMPSDDAMADAEGKPPLEARMQAYSAFASRTSAVGSLLDKLNIALPAAVGGHAPLERRSSSRESSATDDELVAEVEAKFEAEQKHLGKLAREAQSTIDKTSAMIEELEAKVKEADADSAEADALGVELEKAVALRDSERRRLEKLEAEKKHRNTRATRFQSKPDHVKKAIANGLVGQMEEIAEDDDASRKSKQD